MFGETGGPSDAWSNGTVGGNVFAGGNALL